MCKGLWGVSDSSGNQSECQVFLQDRNGTNAQYEDASMLLLYSLDLYINGKYGCNRREHLDSGMRRNDGISEVYS
ncbi:MAG: hypothetical protein AB2693_06070 [Candidatus Thiodiazotropha sp.]